MYVLLNSVEPACSSESETLKQGDIAGVWRIYIYIYDVLYYMINHCDSETTLEPDFTLTWVRQSTSISCHWLSLKPKLGA